MCWSIADRKRGKTVMFRQNISYSLFFLNTLDDEAFFHLFYCHFQTALFVAADSASLGSTQQFREIHFTKEWLTSLLVNCKQTKSFNLTLIVLKLQMWQWTLQFLNQRNSIRTKMEKYILVLLFFSLWKNKLVFCCEKLLCYALTAF